MRRRLILIATAATLATLAVLAPAGAGAGVGKRVPATTNIAINGSRSHAPIFVRCSAGAHRGTATTRNVIDAFGVKGRQSLVQIVPDGTRRFAVTAGTPTGIPSNVRVPCGARP